MFSEALIELEKLSDTDGRQQKRNRQSGGVSRQQQHAAENCRARGGQRENCRENRPDARRPTECKRESEQESAPNSRLLGCTAQMHVAIQPASQSRAKKSNHRQREKVHRAEMKEKRIAPDQRNNSEYHQQRAENNSDLERQLDEHAQQMQAEQNNQRTGDRRERCTIFAQERTDGAGRCAKRNEYGRKSEHKRKRRCKKSAARLLPLPKLLHANSGQHRNVSGHERQHARRKKRNQSREKRGCERNVSVHERNDLESYGMKRSGICSQAACT